MDIKREDYVEVLNNFYLKNNIPADFIFFWYKEKGGILNDSSQFFQLINMSNALHYCIQAIFREMNVKFSINIITKENKFIIAL